MNYDQEVAYVVWVVSPTTNFFTVVVTLSRAEVATPVVFALSSDMLDGCVYVFCAGNWQRAK